MSETRLQAVFTFLQANRHWNHDFQQKEYQRSLSQSADHFGRLAALLHATVNSQSQPKLHKLGAFWRNFQRYRGNAVSTSSLTEFLEERPKQAVKVTARWDRLFHALRAQDGWGDKTAALFVKAAIRVHTGPPAFHFFSDASTAVTLEADDWLYLPVDAVIEHIWKRMELAGPATFRGINETLRGHRRYSPQDMILWDDLWFWGFFTQRSKGSNERTIGWNRDKFWCLTSSPKESAEEVERLCKEFIKILRSR